MKIILSVLFFTLFFSCSDDFVPSQLCDIHEEFTDEFSVLTFNRLETSSLNSAIRLINDLNPDLIGMQESYGVGLDVASSLGYCYYGHEDSSVAFLSKHEIEVINNNFVKIHLSNDKIINFFNVHFTASPYQPYQIRDGELINVWQIEHEAEEARRDELQALLSDMQHVIKDEDIVLVGDFNEPSHLDWTLDAAKQGLNFGFAVNWPISSDLESVGMIDTYREKYPNPLEFSGFTWTPFQSMDEVHDRIDFVYYSGNFELLDVDLVGPDYLSDIIFDYYESDHRSVFCTFSF